MRIRNRGHADVTFPASSYQEAEQAIVRIESERREVLPIDIEGYIHDRLDQDASPVMIDRELELLSQVITWTIRTRRIYPIRRVKKISASR